jgi:hypothetical protein
MAYGQAISQMEIPGEQLLMTPGHSRRRG